MKTAVSWKSVKDDVTPVAAAYAELSARVEALKAEFPDISFGYIGNLSRFGDDRSWSIFLPHPGRVGTIGDRVGGYSTDQLPAMLKVWDVLAAQVRKRMRAS